MTPTRIWLLPLALLVTAGIVFGLLRVDHSLLGPVSVIGPIAVLLFAFAVLYVAWVTRARLAGRPGTKPIDPLVVARFAALGKASAIVGAPLGGIYGGLFGRAVQLSSGVAQEDFKSGLTGLIAGILVCVAGVSLERTCRVKQPPPSGEA